MYAIFPSGSLEESIAFANKRIDKEKDRILSLLRDAIHIISTGEISPDGRTVTDQSVALFLHKTEEFFGENGKYNPRKQ